MFPVFSPLFSSSLRGSVLLVFFSVLVFSPFLCLSSSSSSAGIRVRSYSSPHIGRNSPRRGCKALIATTTSCTEAATACVKDVQPPIATVRAHVEAVVAHIEALSAHMTAVDVRMEAVTACTEDAQPTLR